MNVRCPECLTMYRVDPAKVTGRMRARCTQCAGLLTISAPGAPRVTRTTGLVEETARQVSHQQLDEEKATHASPQHPSEAAEAPEATPPALQVSRPFAQPRAARATQPANRPKRPSAPVFRPTPGMPIQAAPVPPPSRPTAGVVGSLDPRGPDVSGALAVGPDSTVVTAPDSRQPVNPFLSRDPRERARRLARALISEIVVYQPEKRRQALQNGTLPEVFREEIGKSWKEYRQQMGEEFAGSTPYFTEALNEILAEGRQIF